MIDLVGLDTRLKSLEYLYKMLGDKYRPCILCMYSMLRLADLAANVVKAFMSMMKKAKIEGWESILLSQLHFDVLSLKAYLAEIFIVCYTD